MIDRNISSEVDVRYFGKGLQRHLIYILLKISSQYVEKRTYEKKEFAPELTFILFEEPEAFLHPGQQELLSTFSVTLTTKALNQSRLRRFATCSCKPVAGGLLPSLTQLAAAH